MTYIYEVIQFDRTFEPADEDFEVVAANLTAQGTRESNDNAKNFMLIRREADDEDAEYECGAEIDGGTCSRSVDAPDETCFQH